MRPPLQYALSLSAVSVATLVSWLVFRAETYWAPSILVRGLGPLPNTSLVTAWKR